MAKLSKTKEYAIRYLLDIKKTPAEISKELKISIEDVNDVVGEKSAPAKTDKTKDLMIRQTSVKKSNSVSIMTEAAAQLSDEFVKSMNNQQLKSQNYIFRPKQ